MTFKMSPNIAVRSSRFAEAVDFYTNVLGFENRSDDPSLADIDASPLTIYIDADPEFRGPILELTVDDLDSARDLLVANGCKVLRWRGKSQDCYLQDPFGVIFNLWED
jgi:catechol 2,3-dioxygenase-like lactoylglutathione lyase family enzyme